MDSYEHLKRQYDRIQSEQRSDVERQRDEAIALLKECREYIDVDVWPTLRRKIDAAITKAEG